MEYGFESWKEIINTILIGLSTIAILFAAISYKLNLKQHYFTVINNSINKFQDLFITENKLNTEQKLKYLDLVNEQLFYIENYYIPSDVATEWIDGMIDFLPVYDKNMGEIKTNPESKFGSSYENLNIMLFPRILKAFTLNFVPNDSNLNLTHPENYKERQLVVINIFKNIKKNDWFIRRHFAIRRAKKFLKNTYGNQRIWKDKFSKLTNK